MNPTLNDATEELRSRVQSMIDTRNKARNENITGADILQQQRAIKPPEPAQGQSANDFVRTSVTPTIQANQDAIVRSESVFAKERDNVFNQFRALGSEEAPSFSSYFENELGKLGTPDAVNQLREANNELVRLNTQYDVQNVQIEEGNSIGQAQREVTQNDRERAVMTAGVAARAQLLQGNIEIAQSIARDATNFAFQDRQLQLQNMGAQLDYLSRIVEGEEAQLIAERQRLLQQEAEELQFVKDNVSMAIASGGASQSEIAQMTNPMTTDEQKLAIAQSIVGRTATSDRQLQRRAQEASIANVYDQMAQRRIAAAQAARAQADAQADAAEKAKAQKTAASESALEIKRIAESLKGHSGMGGAVGAGFKKTVGSIPLVGRLVGGSDAISGTARANFEADANRLANLLTLDNLDLMSGVLSETDIKILETSGSNLKNFSMSEAAYNDEVDRIINTMTRSINENGMTTEQATFYGYIQDDEASELDYLWDNL
ncbi:hypothetical protein ACMA5I_10315 [Paracoccaceae bacterium GXU_MW_L88]